MSRYDSGTMKILVTGGAGFIGSSFVRYIAKNRPDWEIVNYDALTYAGNLENVAEVENLPNYSFIHAGLGDSEKATEALQGVDIVVNYAAESHNDRAVEDPAAFIRTNVLDTQIFLDAAVRAGVSRFHHISTCEVFGDLALDEERAFKETDPYQPRTPYNASKASTNHIVMAYAHTFGLPVSISHCANNYGAYQFPEKLIPLFTTNALANQKLPLFKSSNHKREWIHADDHSAAVLTIVEKGTEGEAYNIGTGVEKTVEEITDIILDELGKSSELKTYVEDRKGHDRRYLLDTTKLKEATGWQPRIDFETGIRETVQWYVQNPEWWKAVKSGEYLDLNKVKLTQ